MDKRKGKEIVIPKYRTKKKSLHSEEVWHYKFKYSTKWLVFYECIETGFIESWKKTEFIKKSEEKYGEQM